MHERIDRMPTSFSSFRRYSIRRAKRSRLVAIVNFMRFCRTRETRKERHGYWEGGGVAEKITTLFSVQFSRFAAMWTGNNVSRTSRWETLGTIVDRLGEIARASFQHPPDWLWLRAWPSEKCCLLTLLFTGRPFRLIGSGQARFLFFSPPLFFFSSSVSFPLYRCPTFEFVFVNGTFGRLIDVGNVSFIYDVPLTSSWLGIFVFVSRPYRRTRAGRWLWSRIF